MKPPEVYPTAIAECCREWTIALGFRIGKCGICGERPVFKHVLPESEWVRPRPAIDERTKI